MIQTEVATANRTKLHHFVWEFLFFGSFSHCWSFIAIQWAKKKTKQIWCFNHSIARVNQLNLKTVRPKRIHRFRFGYISFAVNTNRMSDKTHYQNWMKFVCFFFFLAQVSKSIDQPKKAVFDAKNSETFVINSCVPGQLIPSADRIGSRFGHFKNRNLKKSKKKLFLMRAKPNWMVFVVSKFQRIETT